MKNIAAKLKAWRGANAIGRGAFTQLEAAAFLGVPFRTYQDWELGRSSPTGLGLATLLDAIKRKPRASKNIKEITL